MGNPTSPPTMPPDDREQVPVLEESLRSEARTESEEVIPLVEEIATVDKRAVVTGRVRVRVVTDTAEEIARADVRKESVDVTRVPVGRVVAVAPEVRTEGDVTIVPVLEEVLVVEKRLVLKEELHIRRRIDAETVEAPVTLRRQRAVVERLDPEAQDSSGTQDASGTKGASEIQDAFETQDSFETKDSFAAQDAQRNPDEETTR